MNTANDLQGILSPFYRKFQQMGRALVIAAFPFSIKDLLDFLTFVFVGLSLGFFGCGGYKNGYNFPFTN